MTNNKLTATVHNVRILPEYFAPIAAGLKRAELRLNDRNYHVGDTLNLNEWDIESQSFTGQFESVRIINVDDVGMLAAGYVLLSFERDVDAELQEHRKAESEAQAILKRLAVIMHGSEVDINLLTVTAQSLVDRCKDKLENSLKFSGEIKKGLAEMIEGMGAEVGVDARYVWERDSDNAK